MWRCLALSEAIVQSCSVLFCLGELIAVPQGLKNTSSFNWRYWRFNLGVSVCKNVCLPLRSGAWFLRMFGTSPQYSNFKELRQEKWITYNNRGHFITLSISACMYVTVKRLFVFYLFHLKIFSSPFSPWRTSHVGSDSVITLKSQFIKNHYNQLKPHCNTVTKED